MRKIKVITDSCSEIPKEWREKYDIDYAFMSIIWNGKEYKADVDWTEFSPKDFYNALRNHENIITSQVSIPEFERIFNKYADDCDIVYVACSSALSASVNYAMKVAEGIMEQHPGCKIRCVDTKMGVGGIALIAVEVAKYAAEGHTVDEVAEYTEKISPTMQQWATIDTLTYLKRAGRVKAGAAFFGNLFGIKPIIISDATGINYAIKKVKGRKNALDECINSLKENICYEGNPYPVSEQTIYLGNADCIEDAEYCKARIMEEIKPKEVFINTIGPIVGTTTGPTTIAMYGFGKPVTVVGEN